MNQLLDIYRRASAHQALTPAERAFLRWVDALVLCVLSAGATSLVALLAGNHGAISWASILQAVGYAMLSALLLALVKFFRAKSDPALADVAQVVADTVDQHAGISTTEAATTAASAPDAPADK